MARFAARVHERRRLVTQLLVRNVKQREIADALRRQGWKVSQPTVARDIQAITAEWRRAAVDALAEHKARQLAILQEVSRTAWLQSPPDLAVILRATEAEIRLLGTAGYSDPTLAVEEELAALGLDAAEVIAKVEAYLAGDTDL